MERREYIVSLNSGVDYNQFWNDMETTTNQHPYVPDHSVDIVNERPGSTRSCHYALTDQEATTLRNDPRVYAVEIPPDQRDDIQIGTSTIVQHGDFTKTTSSTGAYINWGLRRCINYTNPYAVNGTVTGAYTYVNDGTGVDVVIQDSGIQADHPEFFDEFGVTRVQDIDWYTESGLPGTQSSFHYRDFDGHGTHCAGIAAGKNHGWAKNSRIYSLKVRGLEGSGDIDAGTGLGSGIPISDCFDVIKEWHNNKPIEATGYKRPTVVNMSWGYSGAYVNINGGNYRGSNWSGLSKNTGYGMTGNLSGGFYRFPVRVGSVDSDVQEMVDAGIIVCIAAGNSYHKIDVAGGLDYNNYFNGSGEVRYYHRGMSPFSEDAVIVASTDSTLQDGFDKDWDQKSTFSNSGPAIHVYAPGSNIMSSTSNTNNKLGVTNYFYPSFKQVNISGTSMASPQVAGVAALYLQDNPGDDGATFKTWLSSLNDPFNPRVYYGSGFNNDYTNQRSLWGGGQTFLYWPFADPGAAPEGPRTTRVSGPISFKGPVNIRFK